MEDRLCPCAVSNLRNCAWQPVKKGGGKHLSLLSLFPHFPEESFSRAPFLPDLTLFAQVQMLLSNKESSKHYSFECSEESCITYYCETSVKHLLFISTEEWTKGKEFTGWEKVKNFSLMKETEEVLSLKVFWNNTGNDPSSVVYGWSEQGSLLFFSMKALSL